MLRMMEWMNSHIYFDVGFLKRVCVDEEKEEPVTWGKYESVGIIMIRLITQQI